MRKIIILLILSFLSFSCDKENLVTASEIPDWLKSNIENLELQIESGDHPSLNMQLNSTSKFSGQVQSNG